MKAIITSLEEKTFDTIYKIICSKEEKEFNLLFKNKSFSFITFFRKLIQKLIVIEESYITILPQNSNLYINKKRTLSAGLHHPINFTINKNFLNNIPLQRIKKIVTIKPNISHVINSNIEIKNCLLLACLFTNTSYIQSFSHDITFDSFLSFDPSAVTLSKVLALGGNFLEKSSYDERSWFDIIIGAFSNRASTALFALPDVLKLLASESVSTNDHKILITYHRQVSDSLKYYQMLLQNNPESLNSKKQKSSLDESLKYINILKDKILVQQPSEISSLPRLTFSSNLSPLSQNSLRKT